MVAYIDQYRNNQTRSLPAIDPCSPEAEEAVLGALLIDPNAFQNIESLLDSQKFYVSGHAEIFRSIARINKRGQIADLLAVSTDLQDRKKLEAVGGMIKLTQLMAGVVSSGSIQGHAKIVLDKWARREMLWAGRDLADISRDQTWDSDSLFEFVDRFFERVKGLKDHFGNKDKQAIAYTKLVEQIKAIEQGELDPGLRTYRLNQLAQKHGTTTRFLAGLYQKYLASFEIEPAMTLAELKAKYGNTTQEWMLHGFGPAGSVVLLHAHGGTGKTRLIYDWIYAMVTGQAWEGHAVTAPQRRVLLVQTDESQGDMIGALDQRGFTDDMPVKVLTVWNAEHMAGLRKEIEDFKPEVILIDSLTSINRKSMFSENDTEYARPVLELRDIAQEYGCLIYLVHHSNSQNGARGTKAITASVSHVFSLHRPSEGASSTNPNRILCIDKSRCRAPGEYLLEFDPDTGGWKFNGEKENENAPKEEIETTQVKDLVLEFLKENRNVKYEAAELIELLGVPKATIYRSLASLAGAGLINRSKSTIGGGGKRPNVYWVAWNLVSPENFVSPPQNSETKVRQSGETFCKPCSDSVPESSETKFAKTPKKTSQKNSKNFVSSTDSETKQTGQGFEKVSHKVSHKVSPDQIQIGDQVIGRMADSGHCVGGELISMGEQWALILSDNGTKAKVRAGSLQPRPGHFSKRQLDEMVMLELDRLGWSWEQGDEFAIASVGSLLADLSPGRAMNLVYALRKID
jgi:replicative DNA helicase